MHELEITKHILDVSIQEAKVHHAQKITKIHLALGPFSGFVPECIQMYLDVLAKDTIAEGAEICVRTIPLRVECLDCHTIAEIDRHHIECPKCHGLHLKRLSGGECMIESLEVDEDGNQSISSDHGVE
ncbi:hydrogenase maturation nickel metallochaperone HypA [Merdibacter massiliensis]|uniref:hydrogenase maturation nickel metallochaperone HypA n=1 Tax=Merdibacter massiliensis TaxID=1871030 RepID=UPI00096A7F5B|nr:hydrogenase maturation nickel metallochaperone HypA [Merdibacter massiliensis]